jgi:hypothetical protein
MIGGNDIVIPALGDAAALHACARIVLHHWPHARFEDAVSGDKYDGIADIPLGRVKELLAYPDAEAEAAWDADKPDSPENSMLYLILSDHCVTAVLDNPDAPVMHSILEAIRKILWIDIVENYAEAA